MRAIGINPLQLAACGILFGIVAAILLFILAMSVSGTRRAPANPNGLTAHAARVSAMNQMIEQQNAGRGQR